MYIRFIGAVAIILLSFNVSAAEQINRLVYLTVLSEDALLDGVPDEFDIKQFTSRLNKELVKRLDDKGFSIDKDNYGYKLKIEIDSMAHKLRPFHFKSQYIINYKVKLIDSDHKELLKTKNNQVNEDQIDLIDEVSEDIINNLVGVVK